MLDISIPHFQKKNSEDRSYEPLHCISNTTTTRQHCSFQSNANRIIINININIKEYRGAKNKKLQSHTIHPQKQQVEMLLSSIQYVQYTSDTCVALRTVPLSTD